MSNPFDFDVSEYVRPPALNVASAIALTSALLHALPRHAPAPVVHAARKLRACGVALQEEWRAADRHTKSEDPRPADQAIDGAWGALHARLEAWQSLDPARVAEVTRARELAAALFPDGLAFLKKPFAEEWAESDKRLRRIAEEKLEKDLDALVGKVFLDEVRAAHARYGKAVGATAARPPSPPPAEVQEPLRAVARAVAAYAVQVVAAVQAGDPHAAALLAALSPIAEHREASARRKGKSASAEPATPETPLPAVPQP